MKIEKLLDYLQFKSEHYYFMFPKHDGPDGLNFTAAPLDPTEVTSGSI